jgi:hypothetical protein
MDLREIGWGVWSVFTWLRIGIVGGLLWTFRFWHHGVSWLVIWLYFPTSVSIIKFSLYPSYRKLSGLPSLGYHDSNINPLLDVLQALARAKVMLWAQASCMTVNHFFSNMGLEVPCWKLLLHKSWIRCFPLLQSDHLGSRWWKNDLRRNILESY